MASNEDRKVNGDTEELHYLHSKKVKRQLLDLFRDMTDKISQTNFQEIFKLFKDADMVITNEEHIVQTFKNNLYRKLVDNFSDMWHKQEIDVGLSSLNFFKEKCKNSTTTWRPTGKTPEEQTKYLRIHYLKKKILILNHIIDYQMEDLKVVIQEVEEKRAFIEAISAERDNISKQMDLRMNQISKKDVDYQKLQNLY